ncbi:MORN repeat-containing protein 3 isoform X1 [Fukomys damarensis]|uniref:MORN repeat-containing protein 3 isoform X1 n=1 Tax=Fukomys damarensis TaxID=885580 RepID=UPI001455AEAC|nr:MORN repeat-containing protein 3 isoform X1 [Fukomys damarensis]XP_033618343.1 MORN repeat-containing protein 3 isoform X1 [Fukomys damarensis]XP_033618344.1 MORN repeat-containing protein 3 isoform X1 [Fukomys damarensis]
MPVSKCPKKSQPPWKGWDEKAQKNGPRHQVYTVNGDHYTGEWKDNLRHGKGTQVWKKTGAIYEGDWRFGKRDGYGTLSLPEQETGKYRRVYLGWWKGDKKSGYGIQFFGPKEYYEGEWCSSQCSGWGRMYYSNGDIYEGHWWKDKPHGEGMLRLSQASRPRRCAAGGLGHVHQDRGGGRRLIPGEEERPCQQLLRRAWPLGSTAALGSERLPALGCLTNRGGSASLPGWPWGPSCHGLRPVSTRQ